MLSYAIIVLTALAALGGAPWWIALVGGVLLSLISIREQQRLRVRFAAIGATEMLTMAALASLATGCAGAAAAFMLGKLIAFAL